MAEKETLTTSDIADDASRRETNDARNTARTASDADAASVDRRSEKAADGTDPVRDEVGTPGVRDAASTDVSSTSGRSEGNGAAAQMTTERPTDRDQTDGRSELLDEGESEDLRRRWGDIQAGFVDRPKEAVSEADELVADTIKRLAQGFAEERDNLEGVWSRGGDVSTEDLRVALQRYRSFFERLLNA